jgi:repressor LexA
VKSYDKTRPIDTVLLDAVPSNYDMAFRAKGDSMSPTFRDGEILFVRKLENFQNGMVAVVEIEGDLFFKKVYKEDEGLLLVSLNRDVDDDGNRLYPDFFAEQYKEFDLVGKVII